MSQVYLDTKERNNTEYKLETMIGVYRKLTGKDVTFEYPVEAWKEDAERVRILFLCYLGWRKLCFDSVPCSQSFIFYLQRLISVLFNFETFFKIQFHAWFPSTLHTLKGQTRIIVTYLISVLVSFFFNKYHKKIYDSPWYCYLFYGWKNHKNQAINIYFFVVISKNTFISKYMY